MVDLPNADRKRLVSVLFGQALASPQGPTHFYRSLILRAHLPEPFLGQILGSWSGDAAADAVQLVVWAAKKGINPVDARYTTLGSILVPLLDDLGVQEAADIAATIAVHRLIVDDGLMNDLLRQFQVPVPYNSPFLTGGAPAALLGSPEFAPAASEVDLQGFLRNEPDVLDVGFLKRAILTSASVCRVETEGGRALGTGFLVARSRMLTNFHVLAAADGQNLEEKAQALIAHFGSIRGSDASEAEGLISPINHPDALLAYSPDDELDFALIRLAEDASASRPALSAGSKGIGKGSPLNLLGHPGGDAMQLALSGNGVVGVFPDTGRIQYVARARRGSSGSPGFDDEWQLIAIHHAEVSRTFGSVREGILMSAIISMIEQFLV